MAGSEDLHSLREHLDQRFAKIEARFDLVDARFDLVDARLDRIEVKVRQELDEAVEQMRAVETSLLTAFHKWASPLEIRERSAEQAIATLTERLGIVEDRLRDIERKSH